MTAARRHRHAARPAGGLPDRRPPRRSGRASPGRVRVDPKLAEDPASFRRYNAACSAAIAGCGKGKDDPPPDPATRTKLRSQALAWLSADLAAWSKRLADDAKARPKYPAHDRALENRPTLRESAIPGPWRPCPNRSEENGCRSGPRWTDSGEVESLAVSECCAFSKDVETLRNSSADSGAPPNFGSC